MMVVIDEVAKYYDEFTLDHVSLSVPPGCITGILGPNGAGKTTLISMIMRQIMPDHGEIRIFGMDYASHEKAIINRIGFVGEKQAFFEKRTVAWLGKFASQFFDKWDEEAFQRYLNAFQLRRRKKVSHLSKGMRTKLALALAFSHQADLFILDEPTSGLDPVFRRQVLDMLRDMVGDEEKSVLVTTHISDDLDRIADRIGFLKDGKLVLETDKDDLFSSWKRIHFRPEALDVEARSQLCCIKDGAFGSSGMTRDFAAFEERLREGMARGDVKVENANLDDVLIALVKGD